MIRIKETKTFKDWFNQLTQKEKLQIAARLERIKTQGYFGDAKSLRKGLCELRWKNGWRIYFITNKESITLIIGGHKNEQEKNIKKARIFIKQYTKSSNK